MSEATTAKPRGRGRPPKKEESGEIRITLDADLERKFRAYCESRGESPSKVFAWWAKARLR